MEEESDLNHQEGKKRLTQRNGYAPGRSLGVFNPTAPE